MCGCAALRAKKAGAAEGWLELKECMRRGRAGCSGEISSYKRVVVAMDAGSGLCNVLFCRKLKLYLGKGQKK